MARMGGVGFHSVPHFARGRNAQVNGIVIHQFAGGTVAAVQNWLRNPASRVSYHFGVGRNGEIRQWVDTNDTAWATGPVNGRTIAIGHEATNQPLTEAQLDATARIIRWARGAHRGIPAGRNGLTGHRQHMSTNCPGNPIMAQLDELQRRSTGAAPAPPPPPAPGGVPPFPGRILINRQPMMNGADVRMWQQRCRDRGFAIAVDGWYGPQSDGVCRRVQAQARLPVDGRVGPNTWPATWRDQGTGGAPAPAPPPAATAPPFPGRILINRQPMMNGADVRTWQTRCRQRGFTLAADGWYGPVSEQTCRRVQAIARLSQDGRVGPNTWPATWRDNGT